MKKPFSIFLVPPNASGPMHIGNALMVALQDILARYHRAKGDSTLWIPSTDHGGYETQVSFERELEKTGQDKSDYASKELFSEIEKFVEKNNTVIKNQLKVLGASVDWDKFRFTMDEKSLLLIDQTFKKMVKDNLLYRRLYMMNYCPVCSTFLADIELKEKEEKMPLYHIKFDLSDGRGHVSLATTRPEFLFSVTHVLAHPNDPQYSQHIGKILTNPVTGQPVKIIASERKWNPEKADKFLAPFCPSFNRYDFEYALRHSLPSQNLLDWQGNMAEKYPGSKPSEARAKEVSFLEKNGHIIKVDETHTEPVLLCKKGHSTENLIVFTWFLRLDDKKHPLREPAIKAMERENLAVIPYWRKKGLVEWMKKMYDWPIARQNVWGIKIPIWYDVSNPEDFTVWFINKKGERLYGNLNDFLKKGISLDEISNGLERIYTGKEANWTLEKVPGKPYLPETDTFDTWFSSGQWANIVYGAQDSQDFLNFYPSDSIIIGHDLLRLSVARKILLSFYATNKLPFRLVYLHPLLKGTDGQKMSKSAGNVVSLEYYLEKFGVDATRMALVSYSSSQDDFIFAEERLEFFSDFEKRLDRIRQLINSIKSYRLDKNTHLDLSPDDEEILFELKQLAKTTGLSIEKYQFSLAQEKVCNFLSRLEKYAQSMQSEGDAETSISLLCNMYEDYLAILHPFMPFATKKL
jgi:valyl-tRNA synthetase